MAIGHGLRVDVCGKGQAKRRSVRRYRWFVAQLCWILQWYPGTMATGRRARTVFSTEKGRCCPRCGWPQTSCRCSQRAEQPVPDRIVARLRIERAGRKGKTVTVVESLPRNRAFLKELLAKLKRACGAGGTIAEDRIEIQGDHRQLLRQLLGDQGWLVKG